MIVYTFQYIIIIINLYNLYIVILFNIKFCLKSFFVFNLLKGTKKKFFFFFF